MQVVEARSGQSAVGDELVLLDEVAGERGSVFTAVGLGEETDFLVVWLVGGESSLS